MSPAIRQNYLRGKTLAFLRQMYPDQVEESGIVSAMYEYHRTEDIADSMEYLVDKGYISRESKPHPVRIGDKVRLYKILPGGIDLVEGLITDPGVPRVEW